MKLALGLLLVLLPSLAFAQQKGAVLQSGVVTPGHPAKWIFNNTIGDGGGSASGSLSEVGITNTGTPIGINDAAITASGGYHSLVFGANTVIGGISGGLISYDAHGPAQKLPLRICQNGTCIQFPFTVGGIVGPNPSVVGDIPVLGNTTGTLLTDSLVPITSLGAFASQFGADVTGATDASAGVQACLNAPGVGGTCHINGTVQLLSNITIPAGTTLDCGVQSGAGLNDPAVPVLLTGPRILLGAAQSIRFGGTSATLQNCVVVPNGMTFPQSGSSSWTGTAIDTNGASAPQIINVAIAGFDTCINTTTNGGSLRPLLRRIWYDCNGLANGSVRTGNAGDLAILEDVAGQPLGTRADNCTRVRQGTGLVMIGSAWGSRVIVQDYQVNQIMMKDGVFIFDQMWVDDARGILGCPFPSDIGVVMNNVNSTRIGHLNLNQQQTGMLISNQNPNQNVYIGHVFLNGINQDGIVIGASSGSLNERAAGAVQIDMLNTNQTNNNVGRFAINYLDNFASDTGDGLTGNSTLTINGGLILGVNGHNAPYINLPTTTDAYRVHISPSLTSDLIPANAIYGTPTISCSNLGGGGTCAIQGSLRTSPWNVLINMMAQSGAGATGTATITFPISTSFPSCIASYQGGWNLPTPLTLSPTSARTVDVLWHQPSPLTPGTAYGLGVNCSAN